MSASRHDVRHSQSSTSGPAPSHVDGAELPAAAARAAWAALVWAVVFAALHVYWVLGGRIGFGDQADPIPLTTSSPAGWALTFAVGAMFLAGLVVPLALVQRWGRRIPRRLLLALTWIGGLVLGLRGASGLLDGLLRAVGVDGGLTGLSYEQTLGTADPSAYTLWSSTAVDLLFFVGGILFTDAARLVGRRRARR